MKILIIAQGTSQAIAAHALLSSIIINRNLKSDEIELFIIVSDVCADKHQKSHRDFTKKLFSRFAKSKVFDSSFLEKALLYQKISFSNMQSVLKKEIGFYHDIILFSRNMQLINELVLTLLKSDLKICFGDVWGFDNNNTAWVKPILGNKYPDFDECSSFFPVELSKDGFANKPVSKIDPVFLKNSIREAQGIFSYELKSVFGSIIDCENPVIILTSNLCDAKILDTSEEEIEVYISCIQQILDKNLNYFVKGHPRENSNQSSLLSAELNKLGYKSQALINSNTFPVELLCFTNPKLEMISIASSSIITCKIIEPMIKFIDLQYSFANHPKIIKSQYDFSCCKQAEYLLKKINFKNFGPIYYEEFFKHENKQDHICDGKKVVNFQNFHSEEKSNLLPSSSKCLSVEPDKKKFDKIIQPSCRFSMENLNEYLKAGDIVEALKLVREAKDANPKNLQIQLIWADLLSNVGQHETALEVYKNLSQLLPLDKGLIQKRDSLIEALKLPVIEQKYWRDRDWRCEFPKAVLDRLQKSLHNYRYRDVPFLKNPFDLAIYTMFFWEQKPRTIFEIGSKSGGGALWMSDLLRNYEIDGHIYSIDVVPVTSFQRPNITFLEGNGRMLERTLSPEFLSSLPRPWLVIEDADHMYPTTLAALKFFHPYILPEEYIVVEDGIISDLTADPQCNSGPHKALKEFLSVHESDYIVDARYCDFFGNNVTWNTNGFLRKVAEKQYPEKKIEVFSNQKADSISLEPIIIEKKAGESIAPVAFKSFTAKLVPTTWEFPCKPSSIDSPALINQHVQNKLKPRLNLGCGSQVHPEWTNVDIMPRHPEVINHDLNKRLPFEDESFEVVYHSHVLEHLSKEQGKAFLAECFRVLKHGGILRVVVPDLERIARLYLENLDNAEEGNERASARHEWMLLELLDQMVRETSGGEMLRYFQLNPMPAEDFVIDRFGHQVLEVIKPMRANPAMKNRAVPPLPRQIDAMEAARFRQSGEIHKWMYDRRSLGRLMADSGFSQISVRRADESVIPDFEKYHFDRMPDGSTRKPDSLFMEAVKP
jgi:cephalosporin hydroxylase/predicted SAM-dependent methyltransferase